MSDQDPLPPDPNADPNQPEGEESYEPLSKFEAAVGYMETDKGHAVTLRVVEMLEKLTPVLKEVLEAKAQAHRLRPKLDFWKWVGLLVARLIVFGAAVGALIYMKKLGTIDPAIALVIGTLVAYFFGYNRSQS